MSRLSAPLRSLPREVTRRDGDTGFPSSVLGAAGEVRAIGRAFERKRAGRATLAAPARRLGNDDARRRAGIAGPPGDSGPAHGGERLLVRRPPRAFGRTPGAGSRRADGSRLPYH